MFKSKTLIKLFGVACVTSLLTACGGGEDTTAVNDTVIIANGADAKTLDPHTSNDLPSYRVSKQIYSTIVDVDSSLNVIPGLAESWKHVSDTNTVFNLRKGVKFHNGEELTSSDIKYSLDRMLDSPAVAHIVSAIEKIETVDKYTVNIITKEPFGPLMYHLAHPAAGILNEKAVTAAGDGYGQSPVGTGPYQFVEWIVGDRIIMKAFDDYYGGKPAVENAIFRAIIEGTNRAIALETGEVHIAYDIEPIDKTVVTDNDKLQLVEEESLSIAFFGFNTKKEPFNDIRVRQAIAYATNSADIVEAVVLGAGVPANSAIGPKVFGHNPDTKYYTQDLEKARQLMAEASYADGFETTIWTNDNPLRVQIAQILQAQLRELNIDMAIEVVEWGAYLDGTSRGDHDMFILGWFTLTGDADYGLYPQYSSSTHGSAGNRSFYTNAEVDRLLKLARKSTDQEKRREYYAEIQNIVQEEVPMVNIYWQFQNVGIQKTVKGFELAATGIHSIKEVSF